MFEAGLQGHSKHVYYSTVVLPHGTNASIPFSDHCTLRLAGHSTYCDEPGGDYYDCLDVTGLSRGTVVIAVGDAMWRGVAVAMLRATARGILRSRCQISGGFGDLLEHMNELPVVDTEGRLSIWTELVGRALRENATSGPLESGLSARSLLATIPAGR